MVEPIQIPNTMPMPTIFLSAASLDLKPWRDTLHASFSRAGFRVLTQDHSLGAAPGDIRRLLTDAINEADCVLHVAGMAYGSDAMAPFPENPWFECSWTQFEYYYAHATGKDAIAFITAPNLSFPFEENGATLEDKEHRRQLQLSHRNRVKNGDFAGTPFAHLNRTANETVASHHQLLEVVAAAIGTLGKSNPSYERVKTELHQVIDALTHVEQKQESASRFSRQSLKITLASLLALGVCLWFVAQGVGKTEKRVASTNILVADLSQKVDARFSKEREYMALILERANQRLSALESMPPAKRFDLALAEIAEEQRIPADELRALLNLYVEIADASTDATALDRYFIQIKRRNFPEAANIAQTEGMASEDRMMLAIKRRSAAEHLAEREDRNVEREGTDAVKHFLRQGQAFGLNSQPELAAACYKKCLALIELVRNGQHLDMIPFYELLAFAFLDQSMAKEAENSLLKAMDIAERGKDSEIHVARVNHSIALLYLLQQKLQPAEEKALASLSSARKLAAAGKPAMTQRLSLLAHILKDRGIPGEAETLFKEALECAASDVDKKIALDGLHAVLWRQGKIAEAESCLRILIKVEKMVYGETHKNLATTLNTLGLVLQSQAKYTESLLYFDRSLGLAKDFPDISVALQASSSSMQMLGDLNGARSASRRYISHVLRNERYSAFSDDWFATALMSYHKLLTQTEEACEGVESDLDDLGKESSLDGAAWNTYLASKIMPCEQIILCESKLRAAEFFYNNTNCSAALTIWTQALKCLGNVRPKSPSDELSVRMNIAACRICVGDNISARNELRALVENLDRLGIRTLLSARARHHLARALLACGQRQPARNALEEALAIYRDCPSDQDSVAHVKESEVLLKSLTD